MMSASPSSTTQNMDLPIHYQTILWQPNEHIHLLLSKSETDIRNMVDQVVEHEIYLDMKIMG